MILSRSVAMPQARAASSLDPTANTRRPNTVRRSTIAASSASASVIQTPGGSTIQAARGNVTSRSLSHVGGTLTVCSCASHLATPRATPSMPRVAMNGTTRSPVMSRPFVSPTNPPASTAAVAAAGTAQPAPIPSAATTPLNAIVAPTDRSMPPLMMMNVTPIAPRATITVWESTMRRLVGERYRDGASARSANAATTTTRARAGPRRAIAPRATLRGRSRPNERSSPSERDRAVTVAPRRASAPPPVLPDAPSDTSLRRALPSAGRRGRHRRHGAAHELEDGHRRVFHLDGVHRGARRRVHALHVSQQPQQKIEGMNRLIRQRSSAVQRPRPAPVRAGVVLRRAMPLHPRRGQEHGAQRPSRHELFQPDEVGRGAVLKDHAQSHARPVALLDQRVDALCRDIERLLHQDVQPPPRGRPSVLGVEPRGRSHEHQLHRPVPEKAVEIAIGRRPIARSHLGRLLWVAPPARHELHARRFPHRPRVRAADVAATEDADAEGHTRAGSSRVAGSSRGART